MFYSTYILKQKGVGNAFAEWGTLLHLIMELYDKGELALWELENYYINNYKNNVILNFPPNKWVDLSASYYDAGLKYLSNFNGHTSELIGAEEKIDFIMEHNGKRVNFVGIIDRLSQDDNGIIIGDYKSKKFKNKTEVEEYFKQLYVYSICIKEKFGKYPYKLEFYCLRDFSKPYETIFNEKKLAEAKDWIFNTIEEISNTDYFDKNPNDFFCRYICSVPCSSCQYRQQE